jgi:uncharacterized protein (TIGR02058 family)
MSLTMSEMEIFLAAFRNKVKSFPYSSLRVDCSRRDKQPPFWIGWKQEPMARVRCVTEMGMGVDVHGRDATKAAKRAVSDAIRHSSLGFVRMLGKTPHDMLVDVTIGVPNPDLVDTSAVAKELPYGTVTVNAVKGGLEIPAESGGDAITIANAAVIVSLDDGK